MPALDELLDARLLQPTAVPRRFAFRHPLVRRAVYESTGGGWRLARARPRGAGAWRRTACGRGARPPRRAVGVRGDAAAIDAAARGGRATAPRAPAAAARWFAAALRLMPDADGRRRLRRAHRASPRCCGPTGDLERCAPRCSRRSTWSRRRDRAAGEAHVRLRGLRELPRPPRAGRATPRRRARIAAGPALARGRDRPARARGGRVLHARRRAERALGRRALAAARRARGSRADRRRRRPRWPTPARSAGLVAEAARERRRGRGAPGRVPDEALAPHLDAVNRLAWAEFLIERYDDAIRHAARGVAVARATGQDQFVPLIVERAGAQLDEARATWRQRRRCRTRRSRRRGRRQRLRDVLGAHDQRPRRAWRRATSTARGAPPSGASRSSRSPDAGSPRWPACASR